MTTSGKVSSVKQLSAGQRGQRGQPRSDPGNNLNPVDLPS